MDRTIRDKVYYENNKPYILERNMDYYYKNKSKISETRRKYYLQKKYGKFIEPAIFIAHGPIIIRFD